MGGRLFVEGDDGAAILGALIGGSDVLKRRSKFHLSYNVIPGLFFVEIFESDGAVREVRLLI